jgi:hypothetical protein
LEQENLLFFRRWMLGLHPLSPLPEPQHLNEFPAIGRNVTTNQSGLLARSDPAGYVGVAYLSQQREEGGLQQTRFRMESSVIISLHHQPAKKSLGQGIQIVDRYAVRPIPH